MTLIFLPDVSVDGFVTALIVPVVMGLLEVSIRHALISEALYLRLDNVVNKYLQKLK